jgi:hypothetical protein
MKPTKAIKKNMIRDYINMFTTGIP